MSNQIKNRFGKIEVSEDVIATITGTVVNDCFGVVGMASRNLSDGLAELLGKDSLKKGIEIRSVDGKLEIDLYIIVVYGINIAETARSLMEKASSLIKETTGLDNFSVNVIVQGVRMSNKDKQ